MIKFCEKQLLRKAHGISGNGSHALYPVFETLPSECRFGCPACKTNRKNASFIPVTINLFNDVK